MIKRGRGGCKVLLFTGSFPPPAAGGSIEYIYNIFSNLPPGSVIVNTSKSNAKQTKEFDLNFPQQVVRRGFIVHVLNETGTNKFKNIAGLFKWVLSGMWMILCERPDVVHIGEYNYSFIAALLAKKIFNTPYVLYTYAEEITYLSTRPLRLWFFQLALKNASAVITVSEYTKSLLIAYGAQPSVIYKVLPSVSERKRRVPPQEEIDGLRSKYNFQDRKILLTIGRLEERKGHLSVIEALPKILESIPTALYVIAGTGPFEARLKEQVLLSKLSQHVLIVGRVSDDEVASLYEVCDIFIMPHRQLPFTFDTEGCPTVFLEASAHGKPVLGGNAGGVADAILDGKTGYIIDGTDTGQISKRVIGLLQNRELSNALGEAGRKYVDKLRPETSAKAIDDINKYLINLKSN